MLHRLMPGLIFQWQLTLASVHFPCAFKTVTFLFHITQFFSIGYYRQVFECKIINIFYTVQGISKGATRAK